MNWRKGALLGGLIVVIAAPAQGQDRMRRPMAGPDGINVEAALRLREELKLSSGQVSQLQELRKQVVAERQKQASDMIELRSRVAAGDLDQDEMRQQLESRRDAMRGTADKHKEQYDKILTEEQRGQLRRAQVNVRREGMRGRAEFERERRFRQPIRRGWRFDS